MHARRGTRSSRRATASATSSTPHRSSPRRTLEYGAVSARRREDNVNAMLTLYQAEWCPYSHRVRQRLTELMLPFVAMQVQPRPEDRAELHNVAGDDSIPLLVTESGEPIGNVDAILEWLDANYAEPHEARGHRAQARAHASASA